MRNARLFPHRWMAVFMALQRSYVPPSEVKPLLRLTTRVSHDEERADGLRRQAKRDRAPRHWLDPLVRS